MTRMMFDCQTWPGDCTLTITGETDEVVQAQSLHVVHMHGQADGPELREMIRASLVPAQAGT